MLRMRFFIRHREKPNSFYLGACLDVLHRHWLYSIVKSLENVAEGP